MGRTIHTRKRASLWGRTRGFVGTGINVSPAGRQATKSQRVRKRISMNKAKNQKLKLAIQKQGRLTRGSLEFLRQSGLEFETSQRRLFSKCLNFPLDILYVRDDDIGNYVSNGVVDLGIIGQNILYEKRPKVKKLLNLRFAFCSLVLAVSKKSKIKTIKDLSGKKVATTYPKSTKIFFKKNNIDVNIVPIGGSVETAPALGLAQGIVDLTSTGSTLRLNDLDEIEKIYDSEAVLIANLKTLSKKPKKQLVEKLVFRFKGMLSGRKYKLVRIVAAEQNLPKLKKLIPGLKSSSIYSLKKAGFVSIQSIIKEDIFWETVEKVKKLGAKEIIVLPIEKIVM